MKNRLFLLLAIVLFFPSCGNFIEKKQASEDAVVGKLDFATARSVIFQPKCIVCHSQYENYPAVKRDINRIVDSINSERMPKSGGPLSAELKKFLSAWAAAGAPEFEGQLPTDLPPIEIEPKWESISENILTPKCVVCHNPNGQANFLNLSNRQSIWDARNGYAQGSQKLLDLDNPENSYLFEVIRDPINPMPPSISRLGPLTQREIDVLVEWVRRGLP